MPVLLPGGFIGNPERGRGYRPTFNMSILLLFSCVELFIRLQACFDCSRDGPASDSVTSHIPWGLCYASTWDLRFYFDDLGITV